MTTLPSVRGMAIVVLCLGLATAPAVAAPRRAPVPTWGEQVASAARLWLGELLGRPAVTAVSGTDAAVVPPAPSPDPEAGIFKLKQHVDNPGQTAMKD